MPAPSLRRSESFLNVRLRAIIIIVIVYINRFHHQSCQDTAVCNTFRDGPLEKLWGGRGIFEPQEFFFVIKFLA